MPSAGSGQRSVSVWSLEPACECDPGAPSCARHNGFRSTGWSLLRKHGFRSTGWSLLRKHGFRSTGWSLLRKHGLSPLPRGGEHVKESRRFFRASLTRGQGDDRKVVYRCCAGLDIHRDTVSALSVAAIILIAKIRKERRANCHGAWRRLVTK
jgi:hypothetical protein